jgi:hypothetical protein
MTLLKKIISPKKLKDAFNILSKQRKDYSAYADIWALRYNWLNYKKQIITQIKAEGHSQNTYPLNIKVALSNLIITKKTLTSHNF